MPKKISTHDECDFCIIHNNKLYVELSITVNSQRLEVITKFIHLGGTLSPTGLEENLYRISKTNCAFGGLVRCSSQV